MSAITASPEIDISELDGAPDEPWLRAFNEQYNELGRQVVANINQNTPFGDCPTSIIKPYDFVHGVSQTIGNPLGVPIKGVYPVSCVGLSVDSTGKQTRGVYNLSLPQIEWHPSTKADGSVVVTATFSPSPTATTGVIGERAGFIRRLNSEAMSLTSNTSANICTSPSVTLTPGTYNITGGVAFLPAASTSITNFQVCVSKTSGSIPATDTVLVPTAGEIRSLWNQAAAAPGASSIGIPLPSYRSEFSESTTLYLVGRATFTVSTMTAYGWMEATRIAPYVTGVTGRVGLLFIGGG